VLPLLQAQAGDVAHGPGQVSGGQLGEPGLGAVLDERQAVPVGQRAQLRHPGRGSEQMHGHDRPGTRPDQLRDGVGIKIAVGGIDIGEDRNGVLRQDGGHGPEVRDRRRDDLVSRVRRRGHDRKMEGSGAGAARDRVAHAVPLRDLAFEGTRLGPPDGVEHARADHPLRGGHLFVAERAARGLGHGRELH
jgi:hypothetical protein